MAVLMGGAGPEPEAQVRTFLQRPKQAADLKVAVDAKARTTPGLCPGLVVTPEQLFVKAPPAPRFDASGAMVEGSVRQRFTTSGCGGFKPLFNVWVITAPGLPVRTVAAYSGTTKAFIDLQEQATPIARAAAGRVSGGCSTLGVIDTKDAGYDAPTGDASRPWREQWLLGGCGGFTEVTLHFLPDRAQQRTVVEAPPEAVRTIEFLSK